MTRNSLLQRSIVHRLPKADSRRIVVVTGARQTGKTTLCKAVYPDLRYVNLDAPENREVVRDLPTPAWSATIGNAVIDEAQKEPLVFDKVKYAFDDEGISFSVLTGSSQILLLKRIRETLAGRAFFYELWPLMQSELRGLSTGKETDSPLLEHLLSAQGVGQVLSRVPPVLVAEDDIAYRQAERHLLDCGGMPALVDLEPEERWEWLKNYGHVYLERDLRDLARLDDLMPFRKFQRLSALRSGRLLNYSKLARDAGLSVDTARRYIQYLTVSFQTLTLQPYSRNLTSSVVKTPKVYWADVGIWRQLTGFMGAMSGQLYETMVVAEIFKWCRSAGKDIHLSFYRTHAGLEIDVLIERGDGIVGIEIKSRASTAQKDVRPLKAVAQALGDRWRGGLVVYAGDRIVHLADPDIWAVPSRRLLQPPEPV